MRTILTLMLCMVCCVGALGQPKEEDAIRQMLGTQVTEWNKGNIAGYMVGYWEDDSLVFIGKNGPTYGYKTTLDRYKKSYPNADAMGRLTSTVANMKRLSDEYYFVIGKWHLARKAGDLSGSYTLLLQKIEGKWVIINDHSS